MSSFRNFLLQDDELDETLQKTDPASKWVRDFVKSDNPKFEGKSKAERIKMALGAFYAKQRNENLDEVKSSSNTKFTRIMKSKAAVKSSLAAPKHSGETCKMCGSSDVKTYSQGDHQCNSCNYSWESKQKNEEVNEATQKHSVTVTVSDPNQVMVSKRNERHQRKINVTASNKENAINTAVNFYKKKGYKIHAHYYNGVKE